MRIFKILLALCLFFQLVAAATLQGRIVDAEGNPLIGANVYLEDTFLGTPSRSDGTFRIDKIPAGQYRLKVSLIGYYSKTLEVRLEQTAVRDLGDISIEVGGLRSETIVVTASKYEQKRQDVSTTMALVNSTELRQRNARTLEDAIRYVPGINMNGSQINIRGASGYSRGAGSRVLLLVDGMPYLTGDSRDAVLESLPMHQIDRVEVIKGAGSALYGSSALGGVVNVITKEITEKPELFLRFYGGIWDKPYYEQWRWSERSRYLAGAQVNFAKKLGPVGLMLGASHDYDDAYKQNDWFKLMKLSGKLQIDLSSVQRWVINTNYMEKRRGNFFYWQNLDHALVPPIEQLHEQVHTQRFYLSSLYRYLLGVDRYYNIRAIWYWNRFTDTIDPVEGVIGNRSTSNFLNLETQLHLSKGINHLGSGLEFNYQNVKSNIFGTI
jgi:iron complex outermembrane receptor protein